MLDSVVDWIEDDIFLKTALLMHSYQQQNEHHTQRKVFMPQTVPEGALMLLHPPAFNSFRRLLRNFPHRFFGVGLPITCCRIITFSSRSTSWISLSASSCSLCLNASSCILCCRDTLCNSSSRDLSSCIITNSIARTVNTLNIHTIHTIFVYYEMTECSSTRKNNTDDIKDNQYESLYNMRWIKLLSHSLLTLGISCLLWRLGLRW